MAINDLLEIKPGILLDGDFNFQSHLNLDKITNKEGELNFNPCKLPNGTYLSDQLKSLIEKINSKMIGSHNPGGVVLSGGPSSGKTHALLALYNFVNNPDQSSIFLDGEGVKFNKFNFTLMKNKTRSCIVYKEKLEDDNLWEFIVKKLDLEEDDSFKGVPKVSDIEKLVENDYIILFIENIEELVESNIQNKVLIQRFLQASFNNHRLFVFLTSSMDREKVKIFTKSIDLCIVEFSAEEYRNEIIFKRLFNNSRKDIYKRAIKGSINNYLDSYKRFNKGVLLEDEMRERLEETYPFHPQIRDLLDDIVGHENLSDILFYLAKSLRSLKSSEDIILLSDLNPALFKDNSREKFSVYSFSLDALKDLKLNNIDYIKKIMVVIFFYTISNKKGATIEDIYKGIVGNSTDENIDLSSSLEIIVEKIEYLIEEEGKYYLEEDHDLDLLIQKRAEKVDYPRAERELLTYIANYLPDDYKIYGYDDIADDYKVKYVFLLKVPKDQDAIKEYLKNLSSEFSYKNRLVFLTSKEEFPFSDYISGVKEVIAAWELEENLEGQSDQILKIVDDKEWKLESKLRVSFSRLLDYKGEELILKDVESDYKINPDATRLRAEILESVRAKEGLLDLEMLMEEFRIDPSKEIVDERRLNKLLKNMLDCGDLLLGEEKELYSDFNIVVNRYSKEVEDKEAKEELLLYLKEILPKDYKVYGFDEWDDNGTIKYLLLVGVADRGDLESYIKENIYSKIEYKNSLVLLTTKEYIFKEEYLKIAKEIIYLRGMLKNSNLKSKVESSLRADEENIKNKLKSLLAQHLFWTSNGEEIVLQSRDVDIPFDLITDISLLKDRILKDIGDNLKRENLENLLDTYKKEVGTPIIDQDQSFYDSIDSLIKDSDIIIKGENIYRDLITLIKEEMILVNPQQLEDRLISFICEGLLEEAIIYGYNDLEDKEELNYILLLKDIPLEELKNFLDENVYSKVEYENMFWVMKFKEPISTNKYDNLLRKIIVLEDIINQESLESEEIKVTLKKSKDKLKGSLEDIFGERIVWERDASGLNLVLEEVDSSSYKLIKFNAKEVKNYILDSLEQREEGFKVKELIYNSRINRANPIIRDDDIELLYELIKELYINESIGIEGFDSSGNLEDFELHDDIVLLRFIDSTQEKDGSEEKDGIEEKDSTQEKDGSEEEDSIQEKDATQEEPVYEEYDVLNIFLD